MSPESNRGIALASILTALAMIAVIYFTTQ